MPGWDACHGGENRGVSAAIVRRSDSERKAKELSVTVDDFVRGGVTLAQLEAANVRFKEASR